MSQEMMGVGWGRWKYVPLPHQTMAEPGNGWVWGCPSLRGAACPEQSRSSPDLRVPGFFFYFRLLFYQCHRSLVSRELVLCVPGLCMGDPGQGRQGWLISLGSIRSWMDPLVLLWMVTLQRQSWELGFTLQWAFSRARPPVPPGSCARQEQA